MIAHPRDDLAAYALGVLDAVEHDAVAAHVAHCDTCRAEIEAFGETAWQLAESASAAPPAALRARIVERAAGKTGGRLGSLLAPLWRPVPLFMPLALAVALAVALAAAANARRDADAYARALGDIAGAQLVALAPTGEGDAQGTLVIPQGGSPYLILRVAEPPSGRLWEAWVIRGDQPVAAGFAERRDGLYTIALTALPGPRDSVAVTLEPAGNRQGPTSKPVLLGRT